jgi:hypothetical protein
VTGRRAAVLAALAVTLVALAGAAVVLTRSVPRLASADGVKVLGYPVDLQPGQTACQTGERITQDARTLAIGVAPAAAGGGPPLEVRIGARTVHARGGYRTGDVKVAVPPGTGGGPVCIRNAGTTPVGLASQTAAIAIPPGLAFTLDGKPQPRAIQMRWLTAPRSGWNAIGPALTRWGYVTAFGAVTPYLAIALFALAFGGAVALAVRGRAGPVAVGLVAFASAAGWALTTPAFHVPDEPQHFAYLQRLAESGHVPTPVPGPVFSPEEGFVFGATGFNQVVGNPAAGRPPWTPATDASIDRGVDGYYHHLRYTQGGDSNTTNNPPLYYAAELGPYWIATAAGGGFLDRLLAARLGSALLVGLTAAFALCFLRELLPRTPWAWAAGALALAVQPLLGFIGGGVNNDAGLFAAGAAVFWLTARALRRGLDTRGAIGIGLAFGLGLVTKATIAGLGPGLVLAAALLLARSPDRRATLRRLALAVGVAAVPVVVYLVLNATVWDRSLLSGGGGVTSSGGAAQAPQWREFLSYLWQFYLPRLPSMHDLQAGIPLYNVWFKGFIGRYGWLDTTFAAAVYPIALAALVAVLALAGAGLWRARATVRTWAPELLVFAGMVAGFLVIVGWAGYVGRLSNGQIFEQARYLLPLGALYAGLIALAVRGAGRLGRIAGSALVALACGHALFSVGLVVSRFYV